MRDWIRIHAIEAMVVAVIIFVLYGGLASLVFTIRYPWATSGHKLYCAVEMFTYQSVTREDCGE